MPEPVPAFIGSAFFTATPTDALSRARARLQAERRRAKSPLRPCGHRDVEVPPDHDPEACRLALDAWIDAWLAATAC